METVLQYLQVASQIILGATPMERSKRTTATISTAVGVAGTVKRGLMTNVRRFEVLQTIAYSQPQATRPA